VNTFPTGEAHRWRSIAEMVPGKNAAQCQSRARDEDFIQAHQHTGEKKSQLPSVVSSAGAVYMLQTSGKVKWLYGDAAVAAEAAEAAKWQDERASSVTKVDTSSSVAAPLAYAPLNGEVNDRLAELRAAYPKGTKRRWRTIARA
jgi:hypothetical protein